MHQSTACIEEIAEEFIYKQVLFLLICIQYHNLI